MPNQMVGEIEARAALAVLLFRMDRGGGGGGGGNFALGAASQ